MLVHRRTVSLLLTVFVVGSDAVIWFVSRGSGLDDRDCGNETRPCKSIAMATSKSQPGDFVYVNGTNSEHSPYFCNDHVVGVGLSFFNYGDSRAFIRCDVFKVVCTESSAQNVSLNGLGFVNTEVIIEGCSLMLRGCVFQASIREGAVPLNLMFGGTSIGSIVVDRCSFRNNSVGPCLSIGGNKIDVTVRNTTFQNNSAIFHLTSDVVDEKQRDYNVRFINVTIANNKCSVRSCVNINAGKSGRSTLQFHNITFKGNLVDQSIMDVVGTSDTTLHLSHFENNTARSIRFRDGNFLHLNISNGTFINNFPSKNSSGGVVMVTTFKDAIVNVFDSRFINNRGGWCGGAICLLNLSGLLLHINNTKFTRNQASFKGGALAIGCDGKTTERNVSVFINNTYFTRNSLSCETTANFQTGGAAMSVASSLIRQLHIERTFFVENKCDQCHAGALLVSGSLFLGNVTMIKNHFRANSGGKICSGLALLVNQSSPREGSSLIMINDHVFEGDRVCSSQYDVYINSNVSIAVNLWKFRNSCGGGTFIGLISDLYQSLSIQDSEFANNSDFAFNLKSYSRSSTYTLKNVTFTDNECRVVPKSPPVIQLLFVGEDNVLNIKGCKFDNNICDLSVIRIQFLASKDKGDLTSMRRFHSNTGFSSIALASELTFAEEGIAEYCHPGPFPSNQSTVNIVDSEFTNNCGMSESTVTLQNGNITLLNNTFRNNFGFAWGSHIHVTDGLATVNIRNTTFLQELSTRRIWKREVQFSGFLTLTSSGVLNISGSSFNFSRFRNIDQLITIRGPSSVAMDNSSLVECSHGSKLELVNFTHCEQLQSFIPSRIVTFIFACRPCRVGTYSTHKGFSVGFHTHSNFTCQQCPFGANCTHNLAAQPNFWGFPVSSDRVEFVYCPHGYCCPNEKYSCHYKNDTHDRSGCQGNRTGILCGECRENFTEALFSTYCQHQSSCDDWWWFSILALFCILMFALYLIHEPPILQLVLKNMFWFSRTPQGMGLEGTHRRKQQSQLGFMKILFYFYQIAGVLTVPSHGTSHVLMNYIVLPFVGWFSFTFPENTSFTVCPYHGLTQTLKTALPSLGVLTMHLSVLCIYVFHVAINKLSKKSTVFPPIDAYLAAIMECLLLSYSALTYTSLKLLRPVEIDGQLRWFYSAAIPMDFSQWWQVFSAFCILTYLVPFIVVLFVGSQRLYRGLVTPGSFVLACYLPLPFLVCWFWRYCRAAGTADSLEREMTSTSEVQSEDVVEDINLSEVVNISSNSLVLEVISAPFRKPKVKSLGKIHWESVLIGRRFILIASALFIPENFLASVCLTVLCLLALLHHVLRKPFHNYYANATETLSLASLVIIATLNIAVGSFYLNGIQFPVSYSWLITTFLYVEAVLLGVVPVAFALVVMVSGISQVFRLFLFLIKLVRISRNNRDLLSIPDHVKEPLLRVPIVE